MFWASMCLSSGEKLRYLCDTGVCRSVWVASFVLVGFNPTSRPDATHTEWQIPVSHRYSNFLLMIGASMPETCREEKCINKYIKQNYEPSWTYLRDYTGMHGQQNIKLSWLLVTECSCWGAVNAYQFCFSLSCSVQSWISVTWLTASTEMCLYEIALYTG